VRSGWRVALRAQPWVWLGLWLMYFALDQGRNEAGLEPIVFLHYGARSLVWAVVGMAVSTPLLLILRRGRLALASLGVPVASWAWLAVFVGLDGLLGMEDGFMPLWEWPLDQALSEYADFLLSMLVWLAAMLAIATRERARQAEVDLAELRWRAQRAQVQALQQQLSPHFLFNTLNGAISLVAEDPDHAQELLTELSSLLRDTLDLDVGSPHPLADELALVRRYLQIEQVRFEDRLHVELAIDPGAESHLVPPLSIQGLVGNAIKHGDQLELKVHAKAQDGGLRVEVANHGTLTPGAGRGIAMLREQLAWLPGSEFSLTEDGGWVRAVLLVRETS